MDINHATKIVEKSWHKMMHVLATGHAKVILVRLWWWQMLVMEIMFVI
jgi:hypothetical protein